MDDFRFDSIAIPAAGGSFSTGVTGNDPEVAAAASRVPAESFFYEAGVVPPNAFAQAPYYLALAVNAAASGQDFESGEGLEQLPSQAEIDAQIAQAETILGFDPRGELFDLLGGRFILFSTLPSFGGEGLSIDVAAAVDTSDAATLSATFDKLATLLGGMDPSVAVAERAVGASTVHAVSDSSNAMVPAVEFGVVDDQAVVGVGAGIDQLATPQGATLADDPQFQAVMAALPADYQQITYVNVGQVIDLLAALFGQIEADISGTAATPAAATGSPDAIRALAAVVYQHEQGVGTSAILYIEG